MIKLQAGRLTERITIEEFTSSVDTNYGQQLKSWQPLKENIPTERIVKRQAEILQDDFQVAAESSEWFRTRYLPINPSAIMRVVYRGKKYNVIGVDEIHPRQGWIWKTEGKDNEDGTVL